MFKTSIKRKNNSLYHGASLTVGDYTKGLGVHTREYKVKERKTDRKINPIMAGYGNELYTIAKRYAKKNGWAIRADWRGFKKVFDPKTGNVSFTPQRIDKAVWCLRDGLAIAKEQRFALMKIWTEK